MTRSILTIASLALMTSAPVLAAETSVEISVVADTSIELSIEPTSSIEDSSIESDDKGRNRRRRSRNTRNRRNNRDGDNQRSGAERDGERPADAQGERPQQDAPSTAERRQFRNQHPDAAEHIRNQQGERGERRAEPARQQARSTAHARPNVTTHRSNNHARPRTTAGHRWHNHWSHGSSLRWYHGVFVYGPNPRHHRGVRAGQYETSTPMPSRAIDRKGAFSVGMTGGTYASGYDLGGDFSDFGMGVNARFRPVEGLGFEIAYSTHDDTFDSDTERTTTMLSPSVQVFLAPWTRLSPYASLGVTWTERSYNDTWTDGFNQYQTATEDGSFGPHVGIGLEIALGQNAAIDFEARALGYLDTQEAGTVPGAVQTTVGANWYF
jgi:opacity protein-like surface antigen